MERLFKRPLDTAVTTVPVLEGMRREPEAREQFATRRHMELEHFGVITTEDGILGCSPDALIKVGKEGHGVK